MFIVGKILITQFASVRSQQVNGKHNLRGYKVAFLCRKKGQMYATPSAVVDEV